MSLMETAARLIRGRRSKKARQAWAWQPDAENLLFVIATTEREAHAALQQANYVPTSPQPGDIVTLRGPIVMHVGIETEAAGSNLRLVPLDAYLTDAIDQTMVRRWLASAAPQIRAHDPAYR